MKKIGLLLLMGLMMAAMPVTETTDHKLNIEIRNINKAKGKILLAIYSDKEHYLDSEYAIAAEGVVTKTGSLTITVKIPFGEYAIGAFHDINDNGELDTNGLGIPNEPYGFSHGKKGTFGPPSFNAAKFEFSQDGQVHGINL
ncbi:DUF2141 domain-containing protein [Aureitalea marina]|uniref:DUF2141 domain-containing protein n=1 Tax=Aureitalea marina TaxID=930804 RepID=A0A2S7KPW3_9FLAO|nr:DUF2141 domain-containing protein [Aureitalea marina]PQB04669.1 hypothetical protein BST85_07000 [Aureitalea marina]